MNFLQLTQRLRQECGVTGTGPTTTTGQTGEMKRLVDWINTAWMDIQTTHQDWGWMRKTATFATVNGQGVYTPAQCGVTDFGMWARDSFRNYVTASGLRSEVFMDYIHYESWRNDYLYGALRFTYTRPLQMSIAPDKSICLGPIAADGYTILGDYFSVPSEMASDSDVPALPTQFHMAIVYRAMMSYGAFESAPEVYQRGEVEFMKLMRRMTADRIPETVFAGALA